MAAHALVSRAFLGRKRVFGLLSVGGDGQLIRRVTVWIDVRVVGTAIHISELVSGAAGLVGTYYSGHQERIDGAQERILRRLRLTEVCQLLRQGFSQHGDSVLYLGGCFSPYVALAVCVAI